MSLPRLFLTILPTFPVNIAIDNVDIFKMNIVALKMENTSGVLSFQNQQLKLDNNETIEQVAKKIEEFPRLNVFDLRGNTLGVSAGERLAEAIKKHPELERCIWSDMFTGRLKTEIPPILKSLCSAMISANCHITELDLSDNAFGPIGAEGISNFLVSPAAYSLNTLRLNNNGLGAGGKIIASCLIECYNNAKRDGKKFELKRFIAGRNRLENPGAIALAEAFKTLQTLEEIRLPQNGILQAGISALAYSFENNLNLKIIDVNDNTCTETGAFDISEVLYYLHNLVELDLGDCLCRDEGVVAILAGLDRKRDNLKKVNLSGNEITPAIIEDIYSFFSSAGMDHVYVNLTCNNFGSSFDDLRKEYQIKGHIDFGESDDDQGSLSPPESDEEDEQIADDGSMEDDQNTSRETVIQTSTNKKTSDQLLDELVNTGFGCMKIDEKNDGVLSFLNQQLKLDTAQDAEKIAQQIETTKIVRTLELQGNTIGVEAGKRLAKALEAHPELEKCLWSDMFTGRLKAEIPPILIELGKAMINAKCKITKLDLSNNAFGPIGADGIKELLESPTSFSLKILELNNNGLGIGGKQIAASLTECLKKSKNLGNENRFRLKTFIAGRNRLENAGAIALSTTFKELGSLEVIQIPQNGINKEGVKAMAEVLKYNSNLKVFNLNDNTATQLGAYEVAKHLKFVPNLEILDLGDCLCRDAGCHAIVDSLDQNIHRKLKEVNLSGSELSPQAAQIIIQKWKKFNNLHTKPILKIGSNNFGQLFENVKAAITNNVDIGESDDDCGSLSSDEEEYKSGSSSDGDEEDEGRETDNNEENSEDDTKQAKGLSMMIKSCEDLIDNLRDEFDSRIQEESAKLLLKLLKPIQQSDEDPIIFEKALKVAEEIVRRVDAVKRNPIPTTTQLLNNCISQCKTLGIKPEIDWGFNVNTSILGKLLHELSRRGYFSLERQVILNYFPPSN